MVFIWFPPLLLLLSEKELIALCVAIIEICKITPVNKLVVFSSLYVKVFNF